MIITDRVHSTTGRLCFDSCLSICLSTPRGRYPHQVQAGGYPTQVQLGGYSTSGTPLSDLARGYPGYCPPSQLSGGYPAGQVSRGLPQQGGTLSTPQPGQRGLPWWGVPRRGGYPTSLVLDTPRSVCLLRSRRRTFLLLLH